MAKWIRKVGGMEVLMILGSDLTLRGKSIFTV